MMSLMSLLVKVSVLVCFAELRNPCSVVEVFVVV